MGKLILTIVLYLTNSKIHLFKEEMGCLWSHQVFTSIILCKLGNSDLPDTDQIWENYFKNVIYFVSLVNVIILY